MSLASDRADFQHFADVETLPASPLYGAIARVIAADPELSALAAGRIPGEPTANGVLAAIHRRLLDRPAHPLAAHYPSVPERPRPTLDLAAALRAFVALERDAIVELVRTRRVQTNEPRRSAVLLPALAEIARIERAPIALVDVGTAAGFTLLVDRWRIEYVGRDGRVATGPSKARVRLRIESTGEALPPVPGPGFGLAAAVGIDPEPVDPGDAEAVRWLDALIWPEQHDRRERLRDALEVARAHRPRIVRGDAVERLGALLDSLPRDAVPVVVHTHVLSKISPAGRASLDSTLARASVGRRVHRLGNDFEKAQGPTYTLHHVVYEGGAERDRRGVARCDGHATFVEWLGGVDRR